ncbi:MULTISPECIES: vWA domain-containing protein [Actinomadura]|uniref:vWA domain-containing protein n=1 Tax=Actinomadura TaxID=1988 RepID=UPI0003AD5B5A|nr:VWA domain-containing protein [Actinomadura madurae]MCP9954441.1 VWA domain-containing protein [Actinomadura madurae]MCP9971183.1 VWA domain-containing protein [Actinomadura madurae]MCQ0004765.1 VWA domain-containing protein [Actinomadura madurae]URM99934.1 VWA domain-containing protein [Actinomadura madurae]URN02103.1 VWA domain-containing protein [Actinomadura madurae]
MSEQPQFTISIDQNKFLPEGGREVHAIVSVEATAAEGAPVPSSTRASEVIIIDTSGSMSYPETKLRAAVAAAQVAIDTLRDGVEFAVVSGSNTATMVYPRQPGLVPANPQTRDEAKHALARLRAAGGTAIGSWLRLADELFGDRGGIRHAILLTDGKNQHETPEELDAVLFRCGGRFVCDCRGVGTDWEVAELRKVASALLGSVDIVADPAGLVADFRAMTEAAMGKSVADVALRVWTPQTARLRFVKQVLPSVEDLTGKRVDSAPQAGDYPLGAWGAESRDYHICVSVPPGEVGKELRAAWVKLVVPGAPGEEARVLASANVLAQWTDDEAESTRINARVAHYTGQAELASAIQEGLQARKDGDLDTATARLGRAVVLADEAGNDAITAMLRKVVDVVDPATGTVRLKRNVDKADEMELDTRSSKTIRTRKDETVTTRRGEG